ncbi:hypothetical protein GCM10025879_05100 [Leuconostoc litchii]|nr:hypothetical protein GCM10025879_05100 [Leuconostoc litchii]
MLGENKQCMHARLPLSDKLVNRLKVYPGDTVTYHLREVVLKLCAI